MPKPDVEEIHIARSAGTVCLVTGALDVPLHVTPVVTAVESALV